MDKLFAFADKLEHHYQKAAQKIAKMPQSLLTKTFSGQLVTTEAQLARQEGRDYESALLKEFCHRKERLFSFLLLLGSPTFLFQFI